MTKAGIVRAKFHRRPQAWWKLKRVTVSRTRTGKYYCCILYECQAEEREPLLPAPERTTGLKYSVPHFYVTDSGEMADPPHWMKRSQEKLADIQRSLSRMQPGSRNYQETVQRLRLVHEHIANQRRDFIHKESRRIANAWDAVCMRDDHIEDLAKGVSLGGALDSGYGMFRECLRYKLARQGKPLILIDRYAPTTRTCSACGFIREPVHYKESSWPCPKCGALHKREVNAAKNIKAQGLTQYFRMEEQRESAQLCG
ncbi:MAG: transposase, partial [Dysosmobacter sp.]|nr:transposase [Dysosmobacter sp.]